jgi:hypothetical protein
MPVPSVIRARGANDGGTKVHPDLGKPECNRHLDHAVWGSVCVGAGAGDRFRKSLLEFVARGKRGHHDRGTKVHPDLANTRYRSRCLGIRPLSRVLCAFMAAVLEIMKLTRWAFHIRVFGSEFAVVSKIANFMKVTRSAVHVLVLGSAFVVVSKIANFALPKSRLDFCVCVLFGTLKFQTPKKTMFLLEQNARK